MIFWEGTDLMYRTSLIFALIAALLMLPAAAMAGERGEKVTICHVGHHGGSRTIEVSEHAAFGWSHDDSTDESTFEEASERASKGKGVRWARTIKKSTHSRVQAKRARMAGHLASHAGDYLGACEVAGENDDTASTTEAPTPPTTEATTPTTQPPAPDLVPVATFEVSFVPSTGGYLTHMDASSSIDPEGNALTYTWTHEAEGVFGSTLESSTAMVWDSAGVSTSGRSITITLEVFDGVYVASTSRTVVVP